MIEAQRPSVYLHVPFCRRRCPYCAFVSGVPQGNEPERYLVAVRDEIVTRAEMIPTDGAWSIFIGGGTPTLPGPEWIARLLSLVREKAYGPATREWSIESLPEYITHETAELLKSAGVNRVTLGLQSLDLSVLETIGRAHQLRVFWDAVRNLRAVGIESIGVDLILGLPGERIDHFRSGLEQLVEDKIPHISAYMLSIEEGTLWGKQRLKTQDWMQRRLFTILARTLRAHGYEQYEVSNYALPGFACMHNQGTWEGRQLLGFGLAAVGTVLRPGHGMVRRQNTVHLQEYLANPLVGYTEEWLTPCDTYNEILMLGLRSKIGLPYDCQFAAEYGHSPADVRKKMQDFQDRGLLQSRGGLWRTTLRGSLWLDSILVELFCG